MEIISKLFQNYVLNVSLLSWLSAQIFKTLIVLLITHKFVPERLVGAGGMPSAHSASVCSLSIAVARKLGFASTEFAITFVLAAIVMYDAMGVRRAAGEHAKVINQLLDKHIPKKNGQEPLFSKRLKEFLGHTPFEVLCGAVLGIVVALIVPVR